MLIFKKNGFTLVELLVTIAIGAIVLSVALPSYRGFVLNSRTSSQANEFFSMINFTRSEAVKRNQRVTICKSRDQATCLVDEASVTSASWAVGWIVFVDGGDVGIVDGTDTILKVQGALAAGTTLMGNAKITNYVSYVASGRMQLANGNLDDSTFSLCSSDISQLRRKIILAQTSSRVRVTKVAPAATCVE